MIPRQRGARAATVARVGTADALLADRLKAGDDDALAEAYDRCSGQVFAAAHRVLGDAAAAEDVVQDVFVDLWLRPEQYDASRSGLPTYLTIVAHRRALDVVRSQLRRMGREERHMRLIPRQRAEGPDEAENVARFLVVREALDQLPVEQRQVIELAYFEGLSFRDVARAVGIAEGTAKSRLRLALSKLESTLDRRLLETS